MFMATNDGLEWSAGDMQPYGPLSMDPAAQVLNYGQALFEGMKAQRSVQGEIVLFRPTANAARMREGAARMSMIAPGEELFIEAVTRTVRENASMVPPMGKGSLYLRPLLIGTGPIIGLGPAPSFTFVVFATAVGAYFKV
jgi:branched-chain amino acid aminotransferase